MRNADSIKAKLRALSREVSLPYEYLQTHYMIERLLYRLSQSRYSSDFVLKGGLLLHAIFDNRSRATRDVDFLARSISNEPERLKTVFAEICQIPSDDALRFDSETIQAETITEDADYSGVRIKLIGYLDRSCSNLQFDIGFGDSVVPSPRTMEYPSMLGMDGAILLVYSKESLIAEKFQAMIYLAQANSRMKDFYDIYTLVSTFSFDGAVLREAVYQTLTRRGTPLTKAPIVFSDDFATLPEKENQWTGFTKRIHVEELSFSAVLSIVKACLGPIYQSILLESEFTMIWNPSDLEWRPLDTAED